MMMRESGEDLQKTFPNIQSRLQNILISIERMRPLPTTVTRVLNILDDANTTAVEISEILGYDQALAANILHAANASTLGYGPSCSNIPDAVMRLGFSRIKTLVLGVAVSGTMIGSLPGYRLGAGELWEHSRATAFASQWIAKEISFPDPEDAYVAGLLHDMGKLLLDQYALADYDRLFNLMSIYHLAFYQVEQRLFGINHAQLGGLMASKWNFPKTLMDAIQYHHDPILAANKPDLAAIVNLANFLCPLDPAVMGRMGKREIHPETLTILRITPENLKDIHRNLASYLKNSSIEN